MHFKQSWLHHPWGFVAFYFTNFLVENEEYVGLYLEGSETE